MPHTKTQRSQSMYEAGHQNTRPANEYVPSPYDDPGNLGLDSLRISDLTTQTRAMLNPGAPYSPAAEPIARSASAAPGSGPSYRKGPPLHSATFDPRNPRPPAQGQGPPPGQFGILPRSSGAEYATVLVPEVKRAIRWNSLNMRPVPKSHIKALRSGEMTTLSLKR